MLIVCEGQKTEPSYFKGLCRIWRLHGAQVTVANPGSASAPMNVVEKAIRLRAERQRKAKSGGLPKFNQVWCVFDFDQHTTYTAAIAEAKKNGLRVASSVPCFEYWYLLHFYYTTKSFADCEQVIREVAGHLPGYAKSQAPLEQLFPRLDTACSNAAKLRKHNEAVGSTRPATDVDLLVSAMQALSIHEVG